MREYELMYIVRPNLDDEGFNGASASVDTIISNLGGEVSDKQPWGKRRLAYPIERHEDGYYVVAKIRLGPDQIGELEEQLRISDDVIRHMLVQPTEPPKPRKQSPEQAETLEAPETDGSDATVETAEVETVSE